LFPIFDSPNVHKAKVVKVWLAQHADRIELVFLPPYSPELNPREYFNGDLRGKIQRGIPPRTSLNSSAPYSGTRGAAITPGQ
jgi:transposase